MPRITTTKPAPKKAAKKAPAKKAPAKRKAAAKPKKDKPIGRPTKYTQELADAICERVAIGESFRKISSSEEMPAISTMFKWMREHEEFSKQYELAKEQCADMMAEELLEIADDGRNDYMEKLDKDDGGVIGYQLNGEHVQRSRLRVDARKWIAAKLKPRKYGDKQEIVGAGGEALIPSTIKVVHE